MRYKIKKIHKQDQKTLNPSFTIRYIIQEWQSPKILGLFKLKPRWVTLGKTYWYSTTFDHYEFVPYEFTTKKKATEYINTIKGA